MGQLHIIDHPLAVDKVSLLRSKDTGNKEFRELIEEVATMICYEATRHIPLKDIEIITPVCKTICKIVADKKFAIIPILRTGIGMTDGMIKLMPTAKVGHIGLYRDPQTLLPVEYYCKLPSDISCREVFVVDPMLATGGSAVAAIDVLIKNGVPANHIKLLCIVTCPEGVSMVHERHPEIDIYSAAHDSHLNDLGYIVPGLGDAGDRLFGTE